MPIKYLGLDYINILKETNNSKQIKLNISDIEIQYLEEEKFFYSKYEDKLNNKKKAVFLQDSHLKHSKCSEQKNFPAKKLKSILKTTKTLNDYETKKLNRFNTSEEKFKILFKKNLPPILNVNNNSQSLIEKIQEFDEIEAKSETDITKIKILESNLVNSSRITITSNYTNYERYSQDSLCSLSNTTSNPTNMEIEPFFSSKNEEDEFNEFIKFKSSSISPSNSEQQTAITEDHSISLNESDEEFNKILAENFTLIIEPSRILNENKLISHSILSSTSSSPSYSPLEEPCLIKTETDPLFITSQIIEIDPVVDRRSKTGIDSIYEKILDLDLNKFENLKLNEDNKFEIVTTSDSDSPSYDMETEDVISSFLSLIEIKKENTKDKSDQTEEIMESDNQQDYLYYFGESIQVISELLDQIEQKHKEDFTSTNQSLIMNKTQETISEELIEKNNKRLNSNSIIDDLDELFSNYKNLERSKLKEDKDEMNKVSTEKNFILTNRTNLIKKSKPNKLNLSEKLTINENASFLPKKNLNFNEPKLYTLPYLNDQIESTIFNKVELVFFKLIKNCFDNLNLSKIYNFNELNKDLTKFLLEQHIKTETNTINNQKWFLLLHFYFVIADLLFNCGWFPMFSFLATIKAQYNQLIKEVDLLLLEIEKIIARETNRINYNIFEDQKNFNLSIKSPKIKILANYMIESFKKNGNKGKFLIIVTRDITGLKESIKYDIELLTKLKVSVFNFTPKINLRKFDEINIYSKYDCLITNNNIQFYDRIDRLFTNVIIFEKMESIENLSLIRATCLKDICEKNAIDFVEFDVYKLNLKTKEIIQDSDSEDSFENKQFIVSTRVASNTNLVDIIEFNMGISIFERDYEYFIHEYKLNYDFISNADILIDEQTGILIQDVDEFINFNPNEIENFLVKILNFKYSLKHLYIFFMSEDNAENLEIYKDFNYIRFCDYCTNSNQHELNFKIKSVFLKDFCVLSSYLNSIYTESLNCREKLTKNYAKLTVKASKEEIFLISLGCFNSYSAQYLLTAHKLAEIYSMELEEFLTRFPLIDSSKAKLFFEILG